MNPQKRNQLNSPEKEQTRLNPLYSQNIGRNEEDIYENSQYNMYFNNDGLNQTQQGGYIPSPYNQNGSNQLNRGMNQIHQGMQQMNLNSSFGMRNFGQPGTLSQSDFKGNGTDGGIPNMLKPQKSEKKETILQTMQSRKTQQKNNNEEDKYGLMGLLNIIKVGDKDLNLLSLGFDLTTLGLNLNSPEYLYSTFASPWNDNPTRIQPEFSIPKCYFLQNPLPLNKHFGKYQDESLFYMFYSMPKDVCQVLAAKELNKRKWIYHTFHKIWLTRAPTSGNEQIQKTQTYEKGPVIYFDYHAWKKVRRDDFVLEYDKVM
eukprot:gene8834-782_t